jgi:glycosyltransferase involved in cell wall biosynthesis
MNENKIIKIVIIYSGARYFGGIETYLKQLFTFIDENKFQLVLLSLGNWPLSDYLQKAGKKVIILSGKRIRPETISEITGYIEKNSINLVVSQGIVANFYARMASKKTGVPNLVTLHSDMKYEYSNPLKRFVFSLSEKLLNKNTKYYIAVSRYLKNCLIEKGIKEKKISVVYNCIEQTSIPVSRKYNDKISRIGSVGRLHQVKGFDSLISAIAILRDEPIVLTIWGEGEERRKLEALIKDLGLSEKVFLPGFNPDINKAIMDIDIYVQPSLNEGFGLSVVEALSLGAPVIVTPVGSLTELVDNDKNGLVTRDNSPEALARGIKKLIDNPGLAEKIGKKASQDTRVRFSTKRWITETEKIYFKVAK